MGYRVQRRVLRSITSIFLNHRWNANIDIEYKQSVIGFIQSHMTNLASLKRHREQQASHLNIFKNVTFAKLVKITVFLATGERKQSFLLNGRCGFQMCHFLTKRKFLWEISGSWANVCVFSLAQNTSLYLMCMLHCTLITVAYSGLVQTCTLDWLKSLICFWWMRVCVNDWSVCACVCVFLNTF